MDFQKFYAGEEFNAYNYWGHTLWISKFGKASKQQIRILLADKLPETMTEEQKERKILYLLTRLKKKGAIVRDADSRKMTNWIIKDE